MARIFIYDNRTFPDPNPNLTPDQVRQTLVTFFPELANAEVKGPAQQGGDYIFTFNRRTGMKGAEEGLVCEECFYTFPKLIKRGDQSMCPACAIKDLFNGFLSNIDAAIPCRIIFDGKTVALSIDNPASNLCGMVGLVDLNDHRI